MPTSEEVADVGADDAQGEEVVSQMSQDDPTQPEGEDPSAVSHAGESATEGAAAVAAAGEEVAAEEEPTSLHDLAQAVNDADENLGLKQERAEAAERAKKAAEAASVAAAAPAVNGDTEGAGEAEPADAQNAEEQPQHEEPEAAEAEPSSDQAEKAKPSSEAKPAEDPWDEEVSEEEKEKVLEEFSRELEATKRFALLDLPADVTAEVWMGEGSLGDMDGRACVCGVLAHC